ncbi:MAG: N-acetylglucosamine-6-phosphate deacetylase [Clostridia bacterium]|nr:N-acetylglucosamine-6-phosphate deacetylase [Clostridia bacterium]
MKGFINQNVYVEGKGIIKSNLGFENGKIVYIGDDATGIEEIPLPEGAIIAPGFIDEHIHGASGSDAMDGTVEHLETIAVSVAGEGTTGFLATTMTQSPANITKALNAVRDYANEKGAKVLGVHLEGPFISLNHVGAQPKEYVANPSVEIFKTYEEASGGKIKIVSLAPENEGSAELIKYLVSKGVVASVGHSDATYADIDKAIENGLKNSTHTYNCQKPLHHREIGTVGTVLLRDELNAEVIADCIHISVPAIKLLVKNKPHDKLTLITDAMRAKNLPDGESELGGQKVFVKNGEARLANGALAGSVLKMNVAVKNMVERVGVSLTDAIDFASANPAKALGLYDSIGSINVGKNADFAVLAPEFSVLLTIRDGEVIYKK